jgi:hypothetical protein
MQEPILFPAQSKIVASAYLKQSKDAENRANLVVSSVADALNVPPGHVLDMSGEQWYFVPANAGPTEVTNAAE